MSVKRAICVVVAVGVAATAREKVMKANIMIAHTQESNALRSDDDDDGGDHHQLQWRRQWQHDLPAHIHPSELELHTLTPVQSIS